MREGLVETVILITLILICTAPINFSESTSIAVNEPPQSSGSEITVVDAMGRTVVLEKMPERVVSLAPSITEILFYLDVKQVVVGVDNFSYHDEYMSIENYMEKHGVEVVGGYAWSTIDVEKILRLKPDLILADKGVHQPLLRVFEDYGLKAVYLYGGSAHSINDIYMDFEILSKIFGVTGRTREFINLIENEFNNYRAKFTVYAGLKTLVVIDIYNGIWVAGKATYIDDILSRLGLVNVVRLTGWVRVDIEQITEWAPDIILIASTAITEETLKGTGIYTLEKPVVFLTEDAVNSLVRPGPRIINAPQLLYEAISKVLSPTTTSTVEQPLMEYPVLYRVALFLLPVFIVGFLAGYVVSMKRR